MTKIEAQADLVKLIDPKGVFSDFFAQGGVYPLFPAPCL